jgi:hypothetical protein
LLPDCLAARFTGSLAAFEEAAACAEESQSFERAADRLRPEVTDLFAAVRWLRRRRTRLQHLFSVLRGLLPTLFADCLPQVDRKSDLASYAKPSALGAPCSDSKLEPRRRRLQESVAVSLYTPGRSDGRPLSLSVVPDGVGELNQAATARFSTARSGGWGRERTRRISTSIETT